MSQARLSAEREKEIRGWIEAHGWRARLWLDSIASDLLRELDAVRADCGRWRETAYADRARLDAVTRERDALSSRLDDFISAHVNGRSANDD